MANDQNIRRGKSEKRIDRRLAGYKPPSNARYQSAQEAISEQQGESSMTVVSPSFSLVTRNAVKREARRDVRSGGLMVDEDGLVTSMYITAAARKATADADYNVRHFYAVTLACVSEILALARKLKRVPDAPAAEAQGSGPRARRAQAQAAAQAEACQKAYDEGLDELGAYLSSYETAYLLLLKRVDRCESFYHAEVSLYLKEALREGRSFWSRLPWRRPLDIPQKAAMNLHYRQLELPAMPVNIFQNMSTADVVERADSLMLPREYGRVATASPDEERAGWMPAAPRAAAQTA